MRRKRPTDKERLDWLQKHNCEVSTGDVVQVWHMDKGDVLDAIFERKTLRATIDAAMLDEARMRQP